MVTFGEKAKIKKRREIWIKVVVMLLQNCNSSRIVFVRFLGELKKPKRHFEINWPLVMHSRWNQAFFITFPYGFTSCRNMFHCYICARHYEAKHGSKYIKLTPTSTYYVCTVCKYIFLYRLTLAVVYYGNR